MTVEPHHTPEELKRLYRTEMNAKLARRIHGVYLARMGRTCPEIMRITGAARRTVQKWVTWYNRGGIEELLDKPRSGRPGLLTTKIETQLASRIDAGPTDNDGVSVFTAPAIGKMVEREFGVLYSIRGIERVLRRLGFSYLSPRPKHEKSDAQAQEAFKKTSRKCWLKSPSKIPTNE